MDLQTCLEQMHQVEMVDQVVEQILQVVLQDLVILLRQTHHKVVLAEVVEVVMEVVEEEQLLLEQQVHHVVEELAEQVLQIIFQDLAHLMQAVVVDQQTVVEVTQLKLVLVELEVVEQEI